MKARRFPADVDAHRDADYRRWLEESATATVLTYCGLIVVLLPAFHFVLAALPGVPPDSLALRLVAAAISLGVGLSVWLIKPLRAYANVLQFANLIPTLVVIAILVVDSGNNHWYVATELLAIFGAQGAFYRTRDLAILMAIGFGFQLGYSAYAGVLYTPANAAALATYGCGYLISFVTAMVRNRVQENEFASVIEAQRTRAVLEERDRALHASQERLREVHAITRFGTLEADLRTGHVEWSPELLHLFGMNANSGQESLAGLYLRSIHPRDEPEVTREIDGARKTGRPFAIDHRVVLRDGIVRWFHLRGRYEYDAEGEPMRYVAAVLDVTARKQAEEDLVRLARIDTLTSLPNRATFQTMLRDALREAQANGTRCAILFLDLDRFKDTNDTLGHALGDTLLRSVAIRFSTMIPPGSTLARWGGDEFVVMLPSIRDDDEAAEVARTLIRTIAEPFFIDEFELSIAVSVGIAIFPDHGTNSTVLIRNADTAMYHAKERDTLHYAFFETSMHEAVTSRHRIQNELRKAATSGDLVLHYQPIVETGDATIVAAEALIRWRQADGTLLYPAAFIPIAEETGLIVTIGSWVLQEACKTLRAWQDAGLRIVLSVNVSARQFVHPEFIDVLRRALASSHADPELLDIEVTETALMTNVDHVAKLVAAIRAMGVTTTIDDFGTGYSSFAYLKRFPLGALKLDRTFVSEMEGSGDRSIIAAIVTIAHTLGLSVTAEGVETAAQLEIARESGCDRAQGYLISKPLPREEFEAFCARAGLLSAPVALRRAAP